MNNFIYWKTLGIVHELTDRVRLAVRPGWEAELYHQLTNVTYDSDEMHAVDLDARLSRNVPLNAIVQQIGRIV